MSILLDASTRVIVQGITGREGTFHAEQMQAMGTQVVGGTSPGQGRHEAPRRAGLQHGRRGGRRRPARTPLASSSRRRSRADAIMEAAAAGITLIVCITEGIPIQDMIRVKDFLRGYPRRD